MKLKTRLIIAFLTVILIPIFLTVSMVCLLGRYQISTIEKTYEISGTTVASLSNSAQVLARLTEKSWHELNEMASKNPENMEDATCLEGFNQKLEKKKAYLQMELTNLKGLFTGKRRKEIEAQLAEIERRLKYMK